MSRPIVLPVQTDAAPARFLSARRAWTILLLVWLAVHFAALFSPPLLDDADAAHANAAQHMALSGDWVTLKIDGIRYLEKAPLSYWLAGIDDHMFGYNAFSAHLPMALGVLATVILAWHWTRRAFNERAAFYAALALLTAVGVFLFTRIDIPEALLTFFIGLALYCFLVGLENRRSALFYVSWAALAIATLTKGLIAPVFFFAAIIPWLLLTGDWRRWREMRIVTGLLLFFAIAAPCTFSPACAIRIRAIQWETIPHSAMCTASSISTSFTSTCCVSSASATRMTTTSSQAGFTG